MKIQYAIICEVKLLHEYYLTKSDGSSIFDSSLTTIIDRLKFLEDRLSNDCPSINDDLSFEIAPANLTGFKGHKLKLLPTYSGFCIAAPVVKKELADGRIVTVPEIFLPRDFRITVQMLRKSAKLDTISNNNFYNKIPACYYFTNTTQSATSIFPCLAEQPVVQDFLSSYEQGNLTRDPFDNSVKAFYYDKDEIPQWAPVSGAGFITEADRKAIAPAFTYYFDNKSNVTTANFTLKDVNGNNLRTISKNVKDTLQASLDFSDVLADSLLPNARGAVTGSLIVSTDNGLDITHPLVFYSSIPSHCWGIVELQGNVSDTRFSLLDDDGYLIENNEPGHPLFEIRIKSMFTFWKYKNNRGKKLKRNSSLDPYLDYNEGNGTMESISFRNSTYEHTAFKDGTKIKYLPNPPSFDNIKIENKRVYIEITVPRSELFETL